jgi:hypothetical protein
MRPRIALICTVWGAEFSDFFCQYSLATLLSPTNLPRACATYDFALLLYTTNADLGRMQAHPNFHKLATLAEIKPIPLETLPPAARSGHWVQWHHALLSSDDYSSFVLLIPDCLYANDAVPQIARALEASDVVFYCIPQVCLEPILPLLKSTEQHVEGHDPHSYLNFDERGIAGLFVKFINPRYAVALHRPDYFVTHPEYVLRASLGQIDIHELTCHALAISSRTKALSYAFNPMSEKAKTAFLGLLAVGVEYTFKYFEQYFRWPASSMQLSRQSTLASWSFAFWEQGISEYSNTKTEIGVSGLSASTLRRTTVTNPRVNFTRTTFRYYATLYALHSGPASSCLPEVKHAIGLAMCLPGFRKIVMGLQPPLTIILPNSAETATVLDMLYGLGNLQDLFKFMLMHVIPGRLTLKRGQAFLLEPIGHKPNETRRFRIADPTLTESLAAAVSGRIASPATYLNDDLIAYTASIRYGPPQDFVQRLVGHASIRSSQVTGEAWS